MILKTRRKKIFYMKRPEHSNLTTFQLFNNSLKLQTLTCQVDVFEKLRAILITEAHY
jgi:hypothetical protein